MGGIHEARARARAIDSTRPTSNLMSNLKTTTATRERAGRTLTPTKGGTVGSPSPPP